MNQKGIILFCLSLLSATVFAQPLSAGFNDHPQENTLTAKTVLPSKSIWEKESVKISLAPVLFFGASAVTWNSREAIRENRNRYIPTFSYHYDDYFQYAPAVTVFGLKAAGVKGRNDFKRSTITYASSVAIMAILVNSIKYTTKVERPDGSSKNSFPSGHSAMAFTNAAFLDKEYGLVNPLYSIGGYSMATMAGAGRSLNNRHWISDVFAGAGIGILSTQLAYFFVDKIYGNKGDNLSLISKLDGNENPSFLAIKLGAALPFESIVENEESKTLAKMGWEAGIEGAYFFNKHWGLGGQITIAGFPFNTDNISPDQSLDITTESLGNINFTAGTYYAIHFSPKWIATIKATAGYNVGAKGLVKLKTEDSDTIIASYTPKNAFQFTTGLSFTYNFSDYLGATLYSDFNYSQSKYRYDVDKSIIETDKPESSYLKQPFNYMTSGVRLTAYF